MMTDRVPSRPLVGVLCCNRVVDGRTAQAVASRFVEPLAMLIDVSVLLVPAMPDAVDAPHLARLLDGLVLTGSCSNLNASRYGGRGSACPDDGRDEVALRLAAAMIARGRPVFGICRGMQELNVLFGGTLADCAGHYRDGGEDDLDRLFAHSHEVEVVAGGMLENLLGRGSQRVNSVHRQAVDRLGAGLTVEATAPERLVEALSAQSCGAPVLGVQWHPEWGASGNAVSRRLYDWFGAAVRERAGA